MDNSKNNLIIFIGAGILLLVLVIFALMGAKSNPGSVASGGNVDLSEIPAVTENDNTRGATNAAVKLIEYSDVECPYCQEYHGQLLDLVEREPLANFSWTYRHFPLTQIHPRAFSYAVAAECAAEQNGFDSFLDTIVNRARGGEDMSEDDLVAIAKSQGLNETSFSACLDSDEAALTVQTQSAQATAAGATGTPFSVFEFNRAITADEVAAIEGLFGQSTRVFVADDNSRIGIGGSLGATQIREIVNLVVDPATDQVVEDISTGTQ